MKVLYVDVYFLFNLAIDLLAIFFASALAQVRSSTASLFFGSSVGALYAVLCVFVSTRKILVIALSFVTLCLTALVVCKRKNRGRILYFCFYYLLFDILLGGLTYMFYLWFLRIENTEKLAVKYENQNARFLLASAVVLIGIGVIKVGRKCICNTVSKVSEKIVIRIFGHEIVTDALVDTGNLLTDPLTGTPVMLMKNAAYFSGFTEVETPGAWPLKIRKCIRVIPYRKLDGDGILTAFKPDSSEIVRGKRKVPINILIAYDKEGGNYGGFESLIPYSALKNV